MIAGLTSAQLVQLADLLRDVSRRAYHGDPIATDPLDDWADLLEQTAEDMEDERNASPE
jgi:hypothetical protein